MFHYMALLGSSLPTMPDSTRDSPITRRSSALGAHLGGPICALEPPAQIDVLRSCVFRRKYWQNVTVSLGGYPRGISLSHSGHPSVPQHSPQIYPQIYPWVYSWTRCDSNCFRCGPGEATRLNAVDLRPRQPQSSHAPQTSQELRPAQCYARIVTRRKCGAAMGRSQAVRHGTLDPAFGGSNPPAPAISQLEMLNVRQGCSPAGSYTGLMFSGLAFSLPYMRLMCLPQAAIAVSG